MDIAKLVAQLVTPGVLAALAGLLGVSEGAVQKGLEAAVPGVLAALAGAATRPGTADALGRALPGAGGLADLAEREPSAAAGKGAELLASILGPETAGALTTALGGYVGIPGAGAGALLGLAASTALGALGQEATSRRLDAKGVLGLLERNRDAISAALPAGFAGKLAAGGLLPAPPAAAPLPRPIAPAPRGNVTRWLLGAVALLLLAWLLVRLIAPAPVAESAPSAMPTPAAAAAGGTPAAPADPLVVGGVDVGAAVSAALASITAAFDGITDPASAEAALPRLTEARDALSGMEGSISSLPEAGHDALKQMVSAALPSIRSAAEPLKTDGPISAVVGPVVDDILARLTAFSA